jgi:hypothetical protein
MASPRKIEWVALIATELPSAQLTALRTRDGRARRLDDQNETGTGRDDDQDDAPALRAPSDTTIDTSSPGQR